MKIRDVALKTSQRRWTIGRSSEGGSEISVLAARHDDDDDSVIVLSVVAKPLTHSNSYGGITVSQKFCNILVAVPAVPDVSAKVVKVMNNIGLRNAILNWYSPSVTRFVSMVWRTASESTVLDQPDLAYYLRCCVWTFDRAVNQGFRGQDVPTV